MAKSNISVYLFESTPQNLVRQFGGNRAEVDIMKYRYKNMSKEEFMKEHPKWKDLCESREDFNLIVI